MMKRLIRKLRQNATRAWLATRTELRKHFGSADYGRWSDRISLSPNWNPRTNRIAEMIPSGVSVLEFGCGSMVLKEYLPAGCTYTGSDLVDRGEGTIVCDLNGPKLPSFAHHRCAVFSGVIEYINDTESVISHIGQFVDTIIASYVTLECVPERLSRRSAGWVNDFTYEEFVELFSRCGFRLDSEENWSEQKIFCFSKAPPPG